MTPEERTKERARYQRRRAAVLAQKKIYYRDRREALIALQNEWNKKNRDKTKKYIRKWVLSHPEEARANVRNRAAKKRNSGGRHTATEIKDLLERQRYRCASPICLKSIRKSYHVDHMMPIALEGRNDIRNIQLLCPKCNRQKAAKHPIDWANENGLLL